MKPELMAEYMRKRRAEAKLSKEANHLPASPVAATVSGKLDIPDNVRANMGKVTDPDKFKGQFEPDYYKTCCIYCGCPEAKLMTRNGFVGYLCHSHSFEVLG